MNNPDYSNPQYLIGAFQKGLTYNNNQITKQAKKANSVQNMHSIIRKFTLY